MYWGSEIVSWKSDFWMHLSVSEWVSDKGLCRNVSRSKNMLATHVVGDYVVGVYAGGEILKSWNLSIILILTATQCKGRETARTSYTTTQNFPPSLRVAAKCFGSCPTLNLEEKTGSIVISKCGSSTCPEERGRRVVLSWERQGACWALISDMLHQAWNYNHIYATDISTKTLHFLGKVSKLRITPKLSGEKPDPN